MVGIGIGIGLGDGWWVMGGVFTGGGIVAGAEGGKALFTYRAYLVIEQPSWLG